MGTSLNNLRSTLFGKVRWPVLALLFCRGDNDFYFREIERSVGISMKDRDALVVWLKDGLDFSELAKKLKKGRNELRNGKWSDA